VKPKILLPIIVASPVLFIAACRTTGDRAALADGGEDLLKFPDASNLVPSSMVLHEVKLFFEMDRAPRKDSDGLEVEEPAVVQIKAPGEVFLAGYVSDPDSMTQKDVDHLRRVGHTFAYAGGQFTVGRFKYAAEHGSLLFVFRDRRGDFSFLFHGRKIVVEQEGAWKPAVLYHQIEEVKDLGPARGAQRGSRKTTSRKITTRLVEEEVQVGPHRIKAKPGAAEWQVDQYAVRAGPGDTIRIDREGEVRTE
jgi:hypothetical protein